MSPFKFAQTGHCALFASGKNGIGSTYSWRKPIFLKESEIRGSLRIGGPCATTEG